MQRVQPDLAIDMHTAADAPAPMPRRAAFYDDIERLQQVLEGMMEEHREGHDSQGNTVGLCPRQMPVSTCGFSLDPSCALTMLLPFRCVPCSQ